VKIEDGSVAWRPFPTWEVWPAPLFLKYSTPPKKKKNFANFKRNDGEVFSYVFFFWGFSMLLLGLCSTLDIFTINAINGHQIQRLGQLLNQRCPSYFDPKS
jgi:hypothetical protein